ncbi:antibiotic biosynthesis monooxygenase family protein [Kiloniella antarctica]|uniref:Antibiotic biosynthesis monooxygenase family protein n=1 Tax=Kiloniella antarctica TaxID=1550907 RepID=A0ABW5BQ70_9PROT
MFNRPFGIATVISFLVMAPAAFAQELKSTINPNTSILTMINVLTPVDGNQDALVEQLELALGSTMINEPGFISGNVHRSLNSKHVVNYAQWQDQASLEAFVKKLQAGEAPDMAQVFKLAMPDYHPYTVVSTYVSKN